MSTSRPALTAAVQSPQQLRYASLLQWGTRIRDGCPDSALDSVAKEIVRALAVAGVQVGDGQLPRSAFQNHQPIFRHNDVSGSTLSHP